MSKKLIFLIAIIIAFVVSGGTIGIIEIIKRFISKPKNTHSTELDESKNGS